MEEVDTDKRWIFVVSDATGNTAEKMVRAALLQFGHGEAELRIWRRVRTFDEVEQMVAHASQVDALIVFTMVNAQLRQHLVDLASQQGRTIVDLLGGLLAQLSLFLDSQPRGLPGLLHRMDEDYFQRIHAMEFSVQHDDGRNPASLRRADIVLVGVSRTSKTPVSTALAAKGYRVSNVPMVKGVEPPAELFELPPGKVFALTIDPAQLMNIRKRRLAQMGVLASGEYADRRHVFDEVRWALDVYRSRGGWPILDVTSLAVEETAAEILKIKAQLELESAIGET